MTTIAYITAEAPGAYPNGTHVEKCNSMVGDTHRDGGIVVGSIGPVEDVPDFLGVRYGYWVRWESQPELPAFVLDKKLRRVEP